MCLWLEENDFAIFRSDKVDGRYEMTQRFTLPGGFECPNLFECGDSWFIWTADGYYYPGTFDGYRFVWNGVRHEAYRDKIPYAAQIFSGTPRCIMIPWLRTPTVADKWTGMMGIPRLLEAVENKTYRRAASQNDREDYLLRMIPIVTDTHPLYKCGNLNVLLNSNQSAIPGCNVSSSDIIKDENVIERTDTDKTRLSVMWE